MQRLTLRRSHWTQALRDTTWRVNNFPRFHRKSAPHPHRLQQSHVSHLVSLVQGLLPVVQLLIQVALLLTEQLLEHKRTCVSASGIHLVTPCCTHKARRPPTFSLSRSTIFRCRAASVSSICWSHWTQTGRAGDGDLSAGHTGAKAIPPSPRRHGPPRSGGWLAL